MEVESDDETVRSIPPTEINEEAGENENEEEVGKGEEDDNLYPVDYIVDHRYTDDNHIQYLIKWKYYGEDENTWEPVNNMWATVDENLIKTYWDSRYENDAPIGLVSDDEDDGEVITRATFTPTSTTNRRGGNKSRRKLRKRPPGHNIPRFFEPEWDPYVDRIVSMFRDPSDGELYAVVNYLQGLLVKMALGNLVFNRVVYKSDICLCGNGPFKIKSLIPGTKTKYDDFAIEGNSAMRLPNLSKATTKFHKIRIG
ncbi:9693_t:CDS:2 [Acaulospora colombiana]|uniref:9693_t:CDS:1 n=1 Tax=Acaulospora colombiana TaxID=27376 RepID=A0ACA9KZR0_9GLOM|nr:9693_t:CDS:2 [Acaulospora colombiana]